MSEAVEQPLVPETMSLWIHRVYTLQPREGDDSARKVLEERNVHPRIIDALESHDIRKLLPVQERVIPFLLLQQLDRYSEASSDLVITAPTGQGKTLCYMLPMVDAIVKSKSSQLSAIIIAPTRELAQQTYDFCAWFMDTDQGNYDLRAGSLLKACCCHGSSMFLENHQYLLNERPQIAIFTPGRFVEHYNHRHASHMKSLDFTRLRYIIMDEVDALLSQSYYNWTSAVVEIGKQCQERDSLVGRYTMPSRRPQKILVSATIPTKSAEIDQLQLHRPLLLKLGERIYTVPEKLHQKYIRVNGGKKLFILFALLYSIFHEAGGTEKAIVFCSQKEKAHRLTRMLDLFFLLSETDARVGELSSLLSKKQRQESLNRFRAQNNICLICSDVGARGMNFSETSHIISYDFPKSMRKYIHRIGRTARANQLGTSYVLLDGHSELRFNNFIKEMELSQTQLEPLEQSQIVPEAKEDQLMKVFNRARDMTDRCLELEAAGKISHDAPLPSSWRTLLAREEQRE